MLRTILHLFAAVHFWFSCYYDWNYVHIPPEIHRMGRTFGKTNKLKFLTYWDGLLQAVFFTVCFLNDITGTDTAKGKPFLKRLRDTLLPCLAFPLSMFVGLTFWALYFIDRELVLPRAIDAYFPCWLNHAMHTNIMIFITLELVTSARKYPSRKFGLSVLTAFMVVYLVWIHVIFQYTGMWVYPVLDVLNFPMRCVFFLALLGLSCSLYLLGEVCNSALSSRRKSQTKIKAK